VSAAGETWQLWAMVETVGDQEAREIVVYGTGQPIDANLNLLHISTFQQGMYVWHAFEVI